MQNKNTIFSHSLSKGKMGVTPDRLVFHEFKKELPLTAKGEDNDILDHLEGHLPKERQKHLDQAIDEVRKEHADHEHALIEVNHAELSNLAEELKNSTDPQHAKEIIERHLIGKEGKEPEGGKKEIPSSEMLLPNGRKYANLIYERAINEFDGNWTNDDYAKIGGGALLAADKEADRQRHGPNAGEAREKYEGLRLKYNKEIKAVYEKMEAEQPKFIEWAIETLPLPYLIKKNIELGQKALAVSKKLEGLGKYSEVLTKDGVFGLGRRNYGFAGSSDIRFALDGAAATASPETTPENGSERDERVISRNHLSGDFPQPGEYCFELNKFVGLINWLDNQKAIEGGYKPVLDENGDCPVQY